MAKLGNGTKLCERCGRVAKRYWRTNGELLGLCNYHHHIEHPPMQFQYAKRRERGEQP